MYPGVTNYIKCNEHLLKAEANYISGDTSQHNHTPPVLLMFSNEITAPDLPSFDGPECDDRI